MPTKLERETVHGRDTGHSVVMYGLSFCDHCIEGRAFLEAAGIRFDYAFLDRADAPVRAQTTAKLRRAYGQKLIYPILEVDGQYVFGFDEEQWGHRLEF